MHHPRLATHLGEDPTERVRGKRRTDRPDRCGAEPLLVRNIALAEIPQDADGEQRRESGEADHQAEGPVSDDQDWDIVDVIAELIRIEHLVLLANLRDALQRGVEVSARKEGRDAWDRENPRHVLTIIGEVADREKGEGRAVRLGLAHSLGSRHLHGLLLEHELRLEVAGDGHAEPGDDDHDEAELSGGAPHVPGLFVIAGAHGPHYPPHGDAGNECACRQECCRDDVRKRINRRVVGDQRGKVDEFGTSGLGVVFGAHRVLHEGVGNEDPVGREVHANRHAPDRGEVDAFRQAVPAEDPQAQECGLEEERGKRLDREWRAEHIAHEAGVLRPVHPELELLHDSGGHTQCEVDDQQLAD